MKLKEYAAKLTELAKEYPNAKVVYTIDDEGNDFREVNFTPSPGNFGDGEFISDDGTEEFGQQFKINSVCIN